MRLLLLSAFFWHFALSDRRILENYEKKLNAREGQVVGGMVKRYRCIEEYVPIEEVKNYDRKLSMGKRKKLHGVKLDGTFDWRRDDIVADENDTTTDFFQLPFKYVIEIKPKKSRVPAEEVDATLNVKEPNEKAVDEEIEKMLHEGSDTTTTISSVSPIRPQRRKEHLKPNLFDHEMSRGGVPVSDLSRGENIRRAPTRQRQFYVYDFDDETEYTDEDYYEERMPRRRMGSRRRHYAPMRRNMYYYPQRLPYRSLMRQNQYVPLQPMGQQGTVPQYGPLADQQPQQQQYAPQQQQLQPFLQRRPTANLQPLPITQAAQRQPLPLSFARQPMSTVAPPVVMEPAERVNPDVSNELRTHPQRPMQRRLKLKQLPRAEIETVPIPPQSSFTTGQLEEATPENCRKITSMSGQFGIKDISNWSRSNCPTLQMFVPGASCQQLWHFIDSCHKRRFL